VLFWQAKIPIAELWSRAWPDADASLKEIEYSLDTLKADGIGMLTNYGDKWFGDPYFAPIFAELNRRKAVIYTHPTSANCCRNAMAGIPDTIVEYGTDASRAITRTVFSGTPLRDPDVRRRHLSTRRLFPRAFSPRPQGFITIPPMRPTRRPGTARDRA
jgi:hypothetical protein